MAGSADAAVLRGQLAATFRTASADPFTQHDEFLLEGFSNTLPGGSGRLVLERFTLPPGATLPSLEASPFVWVDVAEGTLGLTLEADKLPIGWTAGEEKTVIPMNGMPIPIAPGTLMTLRNAGDDPLVLYRMTLTPTDAATPT